MGWRPVYQRWLHFDRDFPPRHQPDGTKLCSYCGKKITDRRRKRWCSDACLAQASIRCLRSAARSHVARRDKGVCSCCGLDTRKFHRQVAATCERSKSEAAALLIGAGFAVSAKSAESFFVKVHVRKGHPTWTVGRSLWEMDHIIPVEDGGGGCGLENLTTLCCKCHARKTRMEAKRRLERKRLKAERGTHECRDLHADEQGRRDGTWD